MHVCWPSSKKVGLPLREWECSHWEDRQGGRDCAYWCQSPRLQPLGTSLCSEGKAQHGPHPPLQSGRVTLGDMGWDASPRRPPLTERWLQGWGLVERLKRQLMHVEVDAAALSLVRGSARLQGTSMDGRGWGTGKCRLNSLWEDRPPLSR